jgi:WD40 repeat protein
MKVRVKVELLDPDEADAAAEIEEALRDSLGGSASDVVVSRGASATVPRVVEVLRGTDGRQADERLGTIEARELGWAFGFVICGTDKALRKLALEHIGKLPDGERRKNISTVMLEHLVSVLANVSSQPTKAELRRAAAALVDSIACGLVTVSSVSQCCLALFRSSETVVPGAVLLAVLISDHSEALLKLPEAVELRKLVAQHQQSLPGYEGVYIAEGMRWSPPLVTKNVTRSSQYTLPRPAFITGISTVANTVIACTSDGSLITFNASGEDVSEVTSFGDAAAVSIDANASRQVAVALAGKEGPRIVTMGDTDGNNEWAQRGTVSIPDFGPRSVPTCVRTMNSPAQLCTSVCDSSRSSISLIDSAASSVVSTFRHHSDVVTTLHVPAAREGLVLSASRDKTVALFDVRSNSKIASMAVHSQTVSSVSSEGDVIVAAGLDGKIAVCDIRNLGQPVGRRTFECSVLRATLGPSHLCAVATHGSVYMMSLHSSEMPIARIEAYSGALCNDLAWIPGRGMVCVASGSTVEVFTCDGASTTPASH